MIVISFVLFPFVDFSNIYVVKFLKGEIMKVVGNQPAVDKTKWLFTDKPPIYSPQRDSATIGIGCNAHCLFKTEAT